MPAASLTAEFLLPFPRYFLLIPKGVRSGTRSPAAISNNVTIRPAAVAFLSSSLGTRSVAVVTFKSGHQR
jgi:hypothetical protein